MGSFPTTALDLILAGDRVGAQDVLAQTHPEGFIDVIGALSERYEAKDLATSGSSVSIGTGTKVFALAAARDWINGQPVYIMEDGDPSGNVMVGKLSVAEALGVITVNVTSILGSGTFTAWTILSLFSVTTVASTPVAVADGGTGVTTASAARSGFELIRVFQILSVLSDPPGTPNSGDAHLVGEAATAAYAGNEGKITTYNGASWDFETPTEGDQAYDQGDDYQYLYKAIAQPTGLWFDSFWSIFQDTNRWNSRTIIDADVTLTAQDHRKVVMASALTTPRTITLPNPGDVIGGELILVRSNISAHNMTVNSAGGGQIDGLSSINLPNQWDRLHLVSSGSLSWVSF